MRRQNQSSKTWQTCPRCDFSVRNYTMGTCCRCGGAWPEWEEEKMIPGRVDEESAKAVIKAHNKKTEFETGATRDDSAGKGRPSLISPVLIHRTAKHLAAGEEHYGKDNWTKGMPYCRTADSLVRHIYQWLAQDDSEDHLAAIACNTMFLMHFEEAIAAGGLPGSLDDRTEAFKKILQSLLTPPPPDATVKAAATGPQTEAFRKALEACGAVVREQESWRKCPCGEVIAPGRFLCLACENNSY